MDINALILDIIASNFTVFTVSIAFSSIIAKLKGHTTLQRLSKYENKIIYSDSLFFDPLSIEEKNKAKEEIQKIKKELLSSNIKKLINSTSEENLTIFYSKITTLKFKKNLLLIFGGGDGVYHPSKNTIKYASSESIGHELLHEASSVYDNGVDLIGFCQSKGKVKIGAGINEGYTELLASRIFNKDGKPHAYHEQVRIAKLMELMFDDPKEFEKLYYNANLPGLVHYLERYASRGEIVNLILDIDRSLDYSNASMGIPYIPSIPSIKVKMKLYEWFISKNTDPIKLKQFNDIIGKDKLVTMLLNKRKLKMHNEQYNIENKTQRAI